VFIHDVQHRLLDVADSCWCFFVFGRVAWHSFGRKPCARHWRSFCFQWLHRNNFVFIRSHARERLAVEILPVPHRKHSLGLGACATRFSGAQANGQKSEKHSNELQSAHNHRITVHPSLPRRRPSLGVSLRADIDASMYSAVLLPEFEQKLKCVVAHLEEARIAALLRTGAFVDWRCLDFSESILSFVTPLAFTLVRNIVGSPCRPLNASPNLSIETAPDGGEI
jgi:hypothetical protein